MRLIFVRHAEPDYTIDSLTERGWVEAEYLAERMEKIETKAYYCSPLGRARDTASLTLKRVKREAEICDWLREIWVSDITHWDWLPKDWQSNPDALSLDNWTKMFPDPDKTKAFTDHITEEFDKCLEKHGYKRDGLNYKVLNENDDTIVFFCHFGLQCLLLSHLMHVSPFVLWHTTICAPSSITVVNTEEREEGTALFRVACYGDTSHLYGKMEPSFAGRFCTVYSNKEQLH